MDEHSRRLDETTEITRDRTEAERSFTVFCSRIELSAHLAHAPEAEPLAGSLGRPLPGVPVTLVRRSPGGGITVLDQGAADGELAWLNYRCGVACPRTGARAAVEWRYVCRAFGVVGSVERQRSDQCRAGCIVDA